MAISPERRAEINRRNAQKSTGPRTAAGKAASRRNAQRHGFAALTIPPGRFELREWIPFASPLLDRLAPEGPEETRLAFFIVLSQWFRVRALRAQMSLQFPAPQIHLRRRKRLRPEESVALAVHQFRAFQESASTVDRLSRYHSSLSRAQERARAAFDELRSLRTVDPTDPHFQAKPNIGFQFGSKRLRSDVEIAREFWFGLPKWMAKWLKAQAPVFAAALAPAPERTQPNPLQK